MLEADHHAALRGDQRGQLVVERLTAFGIGPARVQRFEVEAARARGDPDFARDAVAVDDDLAAIVELDLDDAIGRRLKIQFGVFQRLFDVGQRRAGGLIEFNFSHDVPC